MLKFVVGVSIRPSVFFGVNISFLAPVVIMQSTIFHGRILGGLKTLRKSQKTFTIQSGDFRTTRDHPDGGYAALATRYDHFSHGWWWVAPTLRFWRRILNREIRCVSSSVLSAGRLYVAIHSTLFMCVLLGLESELVVFQITITVDFSFALRFPRTVRQRKWCPVSWRRDMPCRKESWQNPQRSYSKDLWLLPLKHGCWPLAPLRTQCNNSCFCVGSVIYGLH